MNLKIILCYSSVLQFQVWFRVKREIFISLLELKEFHPVTVLLI